MSAGVERALELAKSAAQGLTNERADSIDVRTRRLLAELAAAGITGGPMASEMIRISLEEVDERAKAILEAVKRGATTVGLHYSKTLASELQAGFDRLFSEQARIVESQTMHNAQTMPLPNAGAVGLSAIGAVQQRVMRAKGAAATEIDHFVESLRTSQREQRDRALWGAACALGGAGVAKAFDWVPAWIHH